MNDHFPSMSQFCLPPRLDSSFFIITHRNYRPKRETQSGGRGTAKILARTHSYHEAPSKAEVEGGAFANGF